MKRKMDFTSEDRERPEHFTDQREPWESLVCAIIKCACDDYREYSGKGRQDIERFIRSEYFSTISNIDPEWLISSLQETFKPRTGMIRGESNGKSVNRL